MRPSAESAESAESESALVLVASSPSGAFAASRVDVPSLSGAAPTLVAVGACAAASLRVFSRSPAPPLARVGEPSTAPLARVSGFAASPDARARAAVAAFVPAGETNDARRDEKARTGAVVVDDAEAFVGEIE